MSGTKHCLSQFQQRGIRKQCFMSAIWIGSESDVQLQLWPGCDLSLVLKQCVSTRHKISSAV